MNDQTLGDSVSQSIRKYFKDMEEEQANNLYACVMSVIEPPLLSVVMEHAEGNQSQAAKILGINRNTLRKKLKQYKLLSSS